jgi:hypothetical protein
MMLTQIVITANMIDHLQKNWLRWEEARTTVAAIMASHLTSHVLSDCRRSSIMRTDTR